MEAAKVGNEAKTVKKRRKAAGEDDMVETTLAAAAAALFVSGVKTLLQCVLGGQWPGFLLGPSPFLFLLLHVVIASIVFASTHPVRAKTIEGRKKGMRCGEKRSEAARTATASQRKRQKQRSGRRCAEGRADEGREDKAEEGDRGGAGADELNARAEAFILAFRQHLKLDSVSSNAHCR